MSSTFFQRLIATALDREGVAYLYAALEDEYAVQAAATVNGDYPAGRSIPPMPPRLLAVFPELPRELRYSFVNRDLILWDLHAGLIVDLLPDALPSLTTQ